MIQGVLFLNYIYAAVDGFFSRTTLFQHNKKYNIILQEALDKGLPCLRPYLSHWPTYYYYYQNKSSCFYAQIIYKI